MWVSGEKRAVVGRAGRIGAIAMIVMALLTGCIGQKEDKGQGWTQLDLAQVPTTVPTAAVKPVPTGQGGVTGVIPPTSAHTLAASQLVSLKPNELGVIPVFMYHALTTKASTTDEWTRTATDFRSDLQWLYDNDFYVISVREMLDDAIAAPPGKHPVILTFDDSSAGQFQFMKNAKGDLVPTPDSSVGILEDFFASHPDFGHTSLFALLPYNCFSSDDVEYNTIDYCTQKLNWLADHGYEIGNHTWGHQDLSNANADEVASQIGQTMDFIDERVKGKGNMSRVLILPYGAKPDPSVDWWAWSNVYEGFMWNGKAVYLDAVMGVSGGVNASPASTAWDPLAMNRFNTEPDLIAYWFNEFENGDLTLYTSDGNPQTVVVPDDLPQQLADEFDPAALEAAGKVALTYDPKSGEVAVAGNPTSKVASVGTSDIAVRDRDRVVTVGLSGRG